jgi:hypothetical protein
VIDALRDSATNRVRSPASDSEPRAGSDAAAGVVVRLSPEARKQLGEHPAEPDSTDRSQKAEHAEKSSKDDEPKGPGEKRLTPKEEQVVHKLEARDTAVRAHEAAHMAAGGGLAGGASYTFETGPDGQRYAVGGEVPVSIAPGRTPDETIQNAQTVRAAALAPADPSSQDMAVAAQATQMEAQARQQKAAQQRDAGAPATGSAPESATGSAPARSSDVGHDSLMVYSAIKAERPEAHGGVAHMHSGADCGFCRAAAARYA